jgi:hypothetical protein
MTKKKDNRTNNDLHNTTQKTKDRATGNPLKPGVNSCAHCIICPSIFGIYKPFLHETDTIKSINKIYHTFGIIESPNS